MKLENNKLTEKLQAVNALIGANKTAEVEKVKKLEAEVFELQEQVKKYEVKEKSIAKTDEQTNKKINKTSCKEIAQLDSERENLIFITFLEKEFVEITLYIPTWKKTKLSVIVGIKHKK